MSSIESAAESVRHGGLIAYPTEAVYGLGCDPFDQAALQRLIDLKGRDGHKGFIVVAGKEEQLQSLILPLEPAYASHVRASWPGPVTWILPATHNLPTELTGNRDTIAVRVSNHPVIVSLCEQLNAPLVSTSANQSGKKELVSATEVTATFGTALDYVVDAPLGTSGQTSAIYDARTLKKIR